MTPEREAYFSKCSEREKEIRMFIKAQNREIKKYKEILSNGHFDNEEESYCYYKIAILKVAVQAFRHELARLKGVDRVVVPKVEGNPPVYYCKCGRMVGFYENGWFDEETYCSDCGRRILWEGVEE